MLFILVDLCGQNKVHMDNTTGVKVGLRIWQRPGYKPRKNLRPGKISGQAGGFAGARANFRPSQGFASARKILG